MLSHELKQFLAEYGLSQADLARLLGVTPRVVSMWVGGRDAPSTTDAYLRLFQSLTHAQRQVEISRLKYRSNVMRDGMYGIRFSGLTGSGSGCLVFDNGKIYGADEGLARYDGEYIYLENSETADIRVKVTIPPNMRSVLGITNPYEWSIDITTEIDPKHDNGKITLKASLGGSIQAEYTFLRPLPEH
jgi:DNA-binding XRE family transcriptional regulator